MTEPFANPDIQYGYDIAYNAVQDIASNPDATEDDKTFRDRVVDLIRWRKLEIPDPWVPRRT